MSLGQFLIPGIFIALFLAFFAVIWWTSHSETYRAWELKELEREKEEKKYRPKPSWADDPVANAIEWTGTAAFGSDPSPNPKGAMVRLNSVSANRIEFRPASAQALYAWMLFLGAVSFIPGYLPSHSVAFALLFPLFFLVCAGLIWLARAATSESLTFDKTLGMYWHGKIPPARDTGAVSSEQCGRISDIYALQLVGTRRYVGDPRMGAGSENKEFPTFEVNLVLNDGKRLSTICLDDYGGIEQDAKALAAFLQKPLWQPFS